MARYLIIGGVAAGMSAAARLRRLDEAAEIVVFERGEHVSYANCGLPYYVGDVIRERDQLLLQTPADFRQRFNVQVRVHSEVLAVDPPRKVVRVRDLSSGREYEEGYDKLLLAPGGSPVRPPIPGADHPAVHTLWTIPDTERSGPWLTRGESRPPCWSAPASSAWRWPRTSMPAASRWWSWSWRAGAGATRL